jgi:predicted RNase H-like HicB family nuclease
VIIKTPKYEVIIYWSEEDQAFIAEVPEVPGCAADGQTHQHALANAEVVIQDWIKTAKNLGRTHPVAKGPGSCSREVAIAVASIASGEANPTGAVK